MRGARPIRHDVVEEKLPHRVPREALPPVLRLAPQVDGAVALLHLDLGVRLKPQARRHPHPCRGESTRSPRNFPDRGV